MWLFHPCASDLVWPTLSTVPGECLYSLNVGVVHVLANTFLKVGDRTIDQMVQAARSGKQNLAEGNIDGITSREMELKLTNVNRASLHELLLDYEDYLTFCSLLK